MWLMHQRLSTLNKFLSQGLGSAQSISRWLIQWKLVHSPRFHITITRWLSPEWDGFKLNTYSTIALRMISAYQTRFHTNLIIFISKHDHVLNMVLLFPSSTPIINPFYFLHLLPLPRIYSRLYQPSEIKVIISPLCGSYRIYSTSWLHKSKYWLLPRYGSSLDQN
jgi:hypothetical protein